MIISARLSAREADATFSGTMVDKSSAIVANAQIAFKNLATGVTQGLFDLDHNNSAGDSVRAESHLVSCLSSKGMARLAHAILIRA